MFISVIMAIVWLVENKQFKVGLRQICERERELWEL